MAWSQLAPSSPHISYIIISFFLLIYGLFSLFIANILHLSEPPLATLLGIVLGPQALGLITPYEWGLTDNMIQEVTRLTLGLQVFAVGVELPVGFMRSNWRSLVFLLGPVMAFGWLMCAAFIWVIFHTDIATSLIISACLTPTDPILSASVLSESRFSTRIPKRIRDLLSAESGCNDGSSFPFLYIGLFALTTISTGDAIKHWVLITLLWQCGLGILLGGTLGFIANHTLKWCDRNKYVGEASYLMFYVLLAIFTTGVASLLGLDDFLAAFTSGIMFARDGWFTSRTEQSKLPQILDLKVNSTLFMFFGASITWKAFHSVDMPRLTIFNLVILLVLVLLFRRLPIILALKPLIPGVHTWNEAWFMGHFGPIGVGALFLAMEARAQLETDTSEPLPKLPHDLPPYRQAAADLIWPIITFIVFGSVFVHGLSPLAISVVNHFMRSKHERAPVIGQSEGIFEGMYHDDED